MIFEKLIAIHNDRIEGYACASMETNDQDMIECFSDLIKTSRVCKMDLVTKIHILGGRADRQHILQGNFLCLLKYTAFAYREIGRQEILDSCNYGEVISRCNYEHVMRSSIRNLILEYSTLIRSHFGLLELDHIKLRLLRDGLAQTA
ncbi:MAG: hypothetical protein ABI002_02260 [Saprospiraceae bacterium]